MELTTVADDLAVLHDGLQVRRYEDLRPGTEHTLDGVTARTLERPPGEMLCRFATVNDVHFGEVECGRVDDHPIGPILRVPDGAEPFPEVMNRGAIQEIAAIDPAAVIVKGDLTSDGTDDELATFDDFYRGAFGDRLHVVRGNHDAYRFQTAYEGDRLLDLPGLRIAMLDTAIPGRTTGRITPAQLAWLAEVAATSDRPVMVVGHHQSWAPGGTRDPDYFGICPDDSERLIELVAHQPAIVAYAAGHTHRNRVRHVAAADAVPFIEVACVKDFPGTWAEYRVYEGGILQVAHRISSPEALTWSDECRSLYRDFGIDYVAYAAGHLEDRCLSIPLRS